MIVGIDIGGTHFRIGGLNSNNEIINFKKVLVKDIFKTNDVLNDIKNMILDNFNIKDIDAISIGVPGTLDVERKTIVQVPNIKGMDNLEIVDYLQDYFKIPVCIDRDVNMLVTYDIVNNKMNSKGITIAVYYGTGIGNAIIIDGKPLIGKDGAAGEIGHIPMDQCDEECGCGNYGCAEAMCGGKYLSKLCNTKFTDINISDVFTKYQNDRDIDLFIDRMAETLCSEINILNPENVIVGGGIINMNDFPIDKLNECVKKHTRKPLPLNNLNIIYVKDEDIKGVYGACLYAKNKFIL